MSQALEKWINPEYVKLYHEGRLSSLRSEGPFRHAVLQNFLNEASIERVLRQCENQNTEKSHRQGIASKADWYWGAFSDLEYLRFFLGQDLRRFMNELMGEKLILKPGAIPQFNCFKPFSKGIPVHTDLNENIGVVTLLQLSEGYQPGRGGELVFYKREGAKICPARVIEPVCNTLILFKVSEISYHSVEDMQDNWTRRTITYDWYSEDQAHVSCTL